jgi:long-chain fatty acid transport protein
MWGTAGMGVDYRDVANNYNMVTNLQLMQFAVPVAYKINSALSLSLTPVLQYGSLDIKYNGSTTNGVAQDLAFGYNLGASYKVDSLTFGAMLKSEIEMDYNGQLKNAGAGFGLNLSDKLSTPMEYGIGTSYKMGANTFALDYKKIKYSTASGYEDFGWEDQDVIALGYQYSQKSWAVRAGYNYATSPISEQLNSSINMLNLLGFPAITESHYTIGSTFELNKQTSVDFAYAYAPETVQNYSNVQTKHSQSSITAQLDFKF